MRGVVGLELEILRDIAHGTGATVHYEDDPGWEAMHALVERGLVILSPYYEESEDDEWEYSDPAITPLGRIVLAASETG